MEKQRFCKKCDELIHPKRISILPNTTTCVKCSGTSKMVAQTMVLGERGDTYNDINIMSEETYINIHGKQSTEDFIS